ncbi:MAG: GDP-mannose 4,6-dehydratase [Candidatus Omnitrophica bacterium]|nr:GDP-mannose 4,6-dehydratase [Candidatus Omnitrophota bacterium]
MINLPYRKDLEHDLSGKQIMITGGLGMLGSTLAHELVRYNAKVTIVDACIEPYGANIFNVQDIRTLVDVNVVDIRDREAMKFLVKDKDIIFNFAAQVSHNDSINDPFFDADINYIGHLNMLESIRKYNPRAKILFSGSRLQFGQIEKTPVNETCPLRPKTPYALNKTAAENMYAYYYAVHGIPCVIFRISNSYGIRCQMKHSKYSIVNYFIRQAMEDKDLVVFGDGEQIRDYIYVMDLVEAFLLAAANNKVNGETFNVGSGVGSKFKDMVKSVVDIVGKGKIKHVPWPENYLNVETGNYIADISKIRKLLNWSPRSNLSEGIRGTYEYYQRYKEYYFKDMA